MKCPKCGMETDTAYCPVCGAQVPSAPTQLNAGVYIPGSGAALEPAAADPAEPDALFPAAPAPAAELWYQKTWTIVLLLLVFWPAGLYLMWKYAAWSRPAKIIVTVVVALCAAAYLAWR